MDVPSTRAAAIDGCVRNRCARKMPKWPHRGARLSSATQRGLCGCRWGCLDKPSALTARSRRDLRRRGLRRRRACLHLGRRRTTGGSASRRRPRCEARGSRRVRREDDALGGDARACTHEREGRDEGSPSRHLRELDVVVSFDGFACVQREALEQVVAAAQPGAEEDRTDDERERAEDVGGRRHRPRRYCGSPRRVSRCSPCRRSTCRGLRARSNRSSGPRSRRRLRRDLPRRDRR
jgi:hypothetical protein